MKDPVDSTAAANYLSYATVRGPAPELSEWLLSWADHHRFKLFLALFALLLLGFNAQWRVEPDSALYLSVGQNLAEGKGYTANGERERLIFPGLPVLFAGIFKVFHGGSVQQALVAGLIVMFVIGLAALALMYRLFLLYADRPTAVMMTFGLGISRLFYRYCFELLSDMPFLLGVMAFLVGHEAIFYRSKQASTRGEPPVPARWFDWVLLVGGLGVAISMRPSMWALLLAIVFALVWSIFRGPVKWPHVLMFLAFALLAAAVLFWRFGLGDAGDSAMGQYEEGLLRNKLTNIGTMFHMMWFENIPRLFELTLSQTLFGTRMGRGIAEIIGATVILISATMLLKRPLWLLWVAMTFVMMLVANKPLDRYFLEILPLLVFAWWSGIKWLNHRLAQPWANWIFLALFLFGGITNLCRTVEFIVEQRRVPFLNFYKDGRYASQDQVAKLVRDHVDENGWVLVTPQFSRALFFLTQRRIVTGFNHEMAKFPKNDFYILEPTDEKGRKGLGVVHCHSGPQVGTDVKSNFDPQPWRLRRAVPD